MTGKKKGGERIAEGSYGCVVTPPPKCKTMVNASTRSAKNTNSTKIAKLFGDYHSMQEEFHLAQQIAQMDPEGKWSTDVYEACAVQAKDLDRQDREECEVTRGLDDHDVVSFIVMQHGGDSLEKYIDEQKHMTLREFCYIFETCVLGLVSMHRRKTMHLDIKPGNVLYDAKANRCYLIDFSLMQELNQPFYGVHNMHIMTYKYTWYPPEFYILSKAEQFGQLKMIDKKHMADRFRAVYGSHGFMSSAELGVLVAEAQEFIVDLERRGLVQGDTTWEVMNKPYLLTPIDIFSLGMTLKEVYEVCVDDKTRVSSIEDLLDGMIHGNPFKRLTDALVYEELSRIIKKMFKVPSLLPGTIMQIPKPSIALEEKKTPIVKAISKLFKKKSSS